MLLGIAIGLLPASLRAAPPTPTPPPTTAVEGWSAWSPVGGPTFLAPSLEANAGTGALELAVVRPDLHIDHFRQSGGSWTGPLATNGLTFMSPTLLVDAGGVPQMLLTGTSTDVIHGRYLSGTWQAPLPTGVGSFFTPGAALNSTGNTLELVTVGLDGAVRHSRFINNAWRTLAPLNAISFLPPALVADPAGGLELAVIGVDRQIYHARYSTNGWSAFLATGVFSELAPALAVGADGAVHLAATQFDRSVVHAVFANGVWSAPVATGVQSDLSPALVFNAGAGSLELLARGLDRTMQHGRFANGAWLKPLSLGITTDARPALVAEAGGTLDAAVVGTDGRVYTSHFSGGPPLVSTTISFSKDILRIFTNNGAKTCARSGCHSGSRPAAGIDLQAGVAYDDIVNVDDLILPGDPDNSRLFQQVDSGRMPRNGGKLADADIERLRQWIADGAPNN